MWVASESKYPKAHLPILGLTGRAAIACINQLHQQSSTMGMTRTQVLTSGLALRTSKFWVLFTAFGATWHLRFIVCLHPHFLLHPMVVSAVFRLARVILIPFDFPPLSMTLCAVLQPRVEILLLVCCHPTPGHLDNPIEVVMKPYGFGYLRALPTNP